jgi:arabinogalactan endo-1,4-beta-galactosidase
MKFLFFLCIVCISVFSGYAQTGNDNYIRGVDISSAPQIINAGGGWKLNSVPGDVLDIFKTNGANYVRLRLWYSPSNGYCGLDSTLAFAVKVKAKGFRFLLDIHYSDTWADPGHQIKPAAWNSLPFSSLNDSVYAYTKRVILALKNQNTLPDMVQVGNEITGGMLWPEGKISSANGWSNFTTLLKSGIQGVRDVADTSTTKIMIHIDRGGDNPTSRWFFDNLKSYSVNFDIIGQSYYPWWHGSFSALQNNLNDLAVRYGKDIVVAETAYPWTSQYVNDGVNNVGFDPTKLLPGYPLNPQGQNDFLTYLNILIKDTPNKKGIGFFYWEPADISVPHVGSAWENYCVFDFNGNAFNSIRVFQNSDSASTVNVKVRLNTATLGDTLKTNGFVQLRGQVVGKSSGFLPSGERITWDPTSQIIMTNIGGDYWQYQFKMYPGDQLQFLFWAGHSLSKPTYRNLGNEILVTPYDSSSGGYRLFIAGLSDTVLDLQFFNSIGNKPDQYWTPVVHKTDSIGILFRVNVLQLMQSGLFDTSNTIPVVVRGDPAASSGILSWSSDKILLKKEPVSVGPGSFWSGVAYFPVNKITAGTPVQYKFFVKNSTFGGWEPTIGNRVFNFPVNDSTLVWKFFNDKNPVTSINDNSLPYPDKFELYQNYPNPFNPATTIKYSIPLRTRVTVGVFNIMGQLVKTLVNETEEAGLHSANWDGRNYSFNMVPSGVYFVRLEADGNVQTRKIILLK